MIPKRAFFFWSSPKPMSWLRSLSIQTFKKFNPDWEVTLFDKVPLNGMHPVHRSDLFRYEELAERGGVYFDTDIVFFRPVPESLLQHDAVISVHPKHRFCNIGCLMARRCSLILPGPQRSVTGRPSTGSSTMGSSSAPTCSTGSSSST
jgi:hypothetical protein